MKYSQTEILNSLEEVINIFEGFAKVVLKDAYVETEAIKKAKEILKERGYNICS